MSLKPPNEPSSEITPENTYLNRADFLKKMALFTGTATLLGGGLTWLSTRGRFRQASAGADMQPALVVDEAIAPNTKYDTDEPKTSFEGITTYNNFYEFGTNKTDPAANAHTLKPRPWTVSIEGEVAKPQLVDIDTLTKWFPLEERVYRMRCVEAWSMVIPWLGFPLSKLIERMEPTSKAKYVAFTTLLDPVRMPIQKSSRSLPWPYVEGLRLDEAMHPLTMLAVGLYGKSLPNQNGAPLRLVVPWKYGFKGIKSIVKIRLTETLPPTSWNVAGPDEYGFFANVNPKVDHPRWSQAAEQRIGEGSRRPTLMFNGYAEHVAALYKGMDLSAFY